MGVFQIHILCFFLLGCMFLLWRTIQGFSVWEDEGPGEYDGFIRALYLAKNGKTVSRSGWLSSDPTKTYFVVYGHLKEGPEDLTWFLCDSAGNCEIYEPTEADKGAGDWFVIK